MAVKMKQDPAHTNATGKAMFEQLQKDRNLKLLPDEKIGGKDAYVIQSTPKKPQDGTTEKHTYYFDKQSGVLVQSVSESKSEQSKSNVTFTLTEMKLNPDLKPELFEFKLPDGVQLMDMTKVNASDQPKPADTAEPVKAESSSQQPDQPKSEPPKQEPKPEKKGVKLPKLKLR
jgi:hypothetical protein